MNSIKKNFLKAIRYRLSANTGFAMIEVLVGVGIAGMILTAFTTFIAQSAKLNRANASSLRAMLYLRETIEVIKDLEQSNWPALGNPLCAQPLECHPQISGSAWTLITGSEILDGTYTRSLTLEPVFRDSCSPPNTIVSATTAGAVICPTPLNPDTRKATATIAWNNGITNRTLKLETYVYKMP